MKLSLSLKLKLKKGDVINGFSFSFAYALLETLKQMKEDNTIFTGKLFYGNDVFYLTDAATPVIYYLSRQVRFDLLIGDDNTGTSAETSSKEDIERLISTAESFLSIFIEKK